MKRTIFTILLFLLLGALVNVAVAWGCALWPKRAPASVIEAVEPILRARYANPVPVADQDRFIEAGWVPMEDEPDCQYSVSSQTVRRFGFSETTYSEGGKWTVVFGEYRLHEATRRREVALQIRARWPMRSMWEERINLPPDTDEAQARSKDAGLTASPAWLAPLGVSEARLVPLHPDWPGFLINTTFYLLILWLLIPGPFVLRRLIRIKRGRCPKCGYDLRGQPPEVGAGGGCPECGWNRQPEATT